MKIKLLNKILAVIMLVVLLVPAGTVFADKGGGGKGPELKVPMEFILFKWLDAPVVAYKGNVDGYKATAPKKGQKIDPNDGDVQAYVGYLNSKHDEALGKVGGGQKLYDYVYTFNGFAAQLSFEQANKMATVEGVLLLSLPMNYNPWILRPLRLSWA